MRKCSFCKNPGTVDGIENAPLIIDAEVGELFGEPIKIETYIVDGELRLEFQNGENQYIAYKKINFCPFCGANLCE